MTDFSTVEDTLFVPMLGRIYASENFPSILKDDKALELKAKLPEKIKGQDTQNQYTLMASAVRSVNMDRYIKDFMSRNKDGVIVMLGAGLETTHYRNDNGTTKWYEVDLETVIEYRRELLGESERDILMAGDALKEDWIKSIREAEGDAPLLVVASGLFYYFKNDDVLNLFRMLKNYGSIEVVFDTVNSSGMKRMGHYMKKVGHEDATMYFYVDNPEDVAKAVGATVIKEEPYYKHVTKKGLKFSTSMTMKMSDLFKMVKMEHLRIN